MGTLQAVGELPAPTRLNLTSRNLQHLLTWEPGPGTPPGTAYRVTKSTERDPETEVDGCGSVLLTCNLTAALGEDPFDSYNIRVEAVNQTSPAAEITRFKPVEHLDLPLLTLTLLNRNLSIKLCPPHSNLSHIYNRIQYQLQIRDGSKPAELVQMDRFSMGEVVLQHLSYGRRYCVSVRFADRLEKIFSNFSQPVCVDTDSVFSTELLLSVLLCLLLTVPVVFVGLFLWTRILCLSKRPSVLTTIHHLEKVLVQSLPELVSSLPSIWPAVPPGGQKALSRSSSEDSEDEEETDSSQEGYKGQGASSSFSSSSGLRPTPTTPPCQKKALVTEDPQTSVEPPVSTAGEGTDERKLLDGEEGAQKVNFLTVTFSWEQEEQQEEEQEEQQEEEQEEQQHLLCFSGPLEEGAGPEEELAGDVVAALPPQQEVVEEEDDDGSGYMCRPPAQSV
ncbi:interferon alpha/beta receptor 2 isoform X2 [Oryzias melastigma]|uniref:interferon alpha/beta receptor 2 isoform X2 n=1 Tax=Oryzias melastigma TaxID=30732 RepID=UPI00168D77D3|nr:interferon alpha/beta receptor 2 isoform X2 [Oryzias melastigma]